VSRKADHQIVDTGPDRIVRHPIYTGIILASAQLVERGAVTPNRHGSMIGPRRTRPV